MWVVITTSTLAVLFTMLAQNARYRRLYEYAFILVTIVQCIAFYGTDYPGYYDSYLFQYYDTPWRDVFDISHSFEPGWIILNKIFPKPYGFFFLTALIHLFQNLVFYKFFKKFVPVKWLWLAMFIYLFSPNLYLVFFSALRQGLAVTLCLCSVFVLEKKRLLPAFVLLLLAISIHRSAMFFLIVFLVQLFPLKYGGIYGIALAFITIVLFFFRENVSNLYSFFMSFNTFEKYDYYYTVNQSASYGLGFFMNLIPYIVFIFFILNKRFPDYSHEIRLFAILAFFHILIMPFKDFSIQTNRLGYYLYPFVTIMIPFSYSKIKNNEVKLGLTFIFIFLTLVRYKIWFTAPPYEDGYAVYKTFFDFISY